MRMAASLATCIAVAAVACDGGSDITAPDQLPPARIVIVSGDGQTAAAGTRLHDSLVVRVTDSKDRPARGQRVEFAASAGTVAPGGAVTNADGRTAAAWALGPVAGRQTATATATGNGAPPGLAVTFRATATASAAVKLEKIAGDGQTAQAGSPVTTPPAVKVADVGGNPVAGVEVTFAVIAGGGSVTPTTPVSTDASGVAAATSWTLGSVAGPNTLTATIPGTGISGNPATFTALGTAGSTYPARIELGTLGGNISYANAINASGVVVGEAETGTGQVRAFRWTLNGGMNDLGTLPGDGGSIATDIDDEGTVLGVSCAGSCTAGVPVYHPVTWDAAGAIHPFVRPFGVPTGYDSVELAGLPNQQGQWAGTAFHPGQWGIGGEAAVFYSAGTGIINLRTLAEASGVDTSVVGPFTYNQAVDLNEPGTVLATGGHEDAWRPFLWSPTAGFRLPGAPPGSDPWGTRVFGNGLNNLDEVVGSYLSEHFDGNSYTFASGAFHWSASEGFVILPSSSTYPPGYATAINDDGDAVGVVWPPPAAAVVWPRSGGIRMLATTAGEASVALAINPSGLAIGWEGTGSGLDNHAILWNTALAPSGVPAVATSVSPSRVTGATAPGAASAASAKVTQCLGRPSSKLARALCIAR